MRFSCIAPALAACTALWSTSAAAQPGAAPQMAEPAQSGPGGIPGIVKTLFDTVINGGRPLDLEARARGDQQDGMTRITDDNYAKIFAQSRPDDVWVLAVHGRVEDLMSNSYLDMHKNASILLQENATLADKAERFKFGRLDWMTDWTVSTRWVMTKPPYLVFVSENGQSLRFVSPPRLVANGTALYEALTQGYWENIPVWDGSLAPGGDLAYLVEAYITFQEYVGRYTSGMPKWMWLGVPMVVSAIGQNIVAWLHSGDAEKQKKHDEASRAGAAAGGAGEKPKSQ